MKKENVFITGGAGYLGCVVADHLLKKGYKVKVFDNLTFGSNPLIFFLDNPQYEFVKGDICDIKLLSNEMESFSTVIHLAAIVGDIPCEKDPKTAIKVNIDASISLIELCKKRGIKFIFASSSSVYGASPMKIATEDCELNPLSLYAETKIKVEQYLKNIDLKDSDFYYTILRPGTAYGLSPRMRSDLLIHFLVKEVITKKRILMYGPKLYRPYIHNTDIALAIGKIITSPPELVGNEIFNLVEENLNKNDLIKILQNFCNFQINYYENPTDIRNYRISGEKIMKRIGFKTKRKIDDVIPAIIQAAKLGVY